VQKKFHLTYPAAVPRINFSEQQRVRRKRPFLDRHYTKYLRGMLCKKLLDRIAIKKGSQESAPWLPGLQGDKQLSF